MKTFEEKTQENWTPVKTNNSYEISDLGRLRHNYKNGKTKVIVPKSNGLNSKYLFYTIDGNKHYAHHLVMLHFVGERPFENEIDHIDRNPLNNALSNLRYVHFTQNRLRGNDHPKAKLTEDLVRVIRQLNLIDGFTQKKIGDFMGVSRTAISKITNYQCWQHV